MLVAILCGWVDKEEQKRDVGKGFLMDSARREVESGGGCVTVCAELSFFPPAFAHQWSPGRCGNVMTGICCWTVCGPNHSAVTYGNEGVDSAVSLWKMAPAISSIYTFLSLNYVWCLFCSQSVRTKMKKGIWLYFLFEIQNCNMPIYLLNFSQYLLKKF